MQLKIFLLGLCLCAAHLASAQTSKFATARILEGWNKDLSQIVVVYETGENEIITLEKNGSGLHFSIDAMIKNQLIINNFLSSMKEKGYAVVNLSSVGDATFYTLIVFTKEVDAGN